MQVIDTGYETRYDDFSSSNYAMDYFLFGSGISA